MRKTVKPIAPEETSPVAEVALRGGGEIGGHVFDPAHPERRFVVELLIDGHPVALARADRFDADLARRGLGDGCHGFVFAVDPAALLDAAMAEVRLANSGEILGAPLRLPAAVADLSGLQRAGGARWLGGLRINGWLPAGSQGRARATVDGQVVAEAAATHWTHIGDARDPVAARGFDLWLPERFADGRMRLAQIFDEAGRELPGSPCAFIASVDGLERFLSAHADVASEAPRGKFFDLLFPQSLPFSMFAQWRRRFAAGIPAEVGAALPRIGVALIGEREISASVDSLERQQGCDWVAAALEGGEGETGFHAESLRAFLDEDAQDSEIIVFAPSGTVFEPDGLARLAQALASFPEAQAAYGDFTIADEDGGEWPVALAAFDYERMLEQGAGGLLFALRRAFARDAAEAGADDLFRLFNAAQDERPSAGARERAPTPPAVHVPGFLARLPRPHATSAARALLRATEAHLQARGVAARVELGFGALFPAVRVLRLQPRGKVSILIPTRDRADLLAECLESLFATVDCARHELIVLDNDSAEEETLHCLDHYAEKGVRVLRVGGPFNFPRIVNKGASIAAGDFLLLLNNDVAALSSGWLEDMLSRMAEPDVGAVGATLLWPSGVVQHGGVTLGPSFDASHAFNDRMDGDAGYADLLRAAHEVSAVTAACLLTDRRLFDEVGGFDAVNFPVNYNDVDYCLKLRARGLRVVQTPHARLLHRESATRGLDARRDRLARLEREMRALRAIWGDALADDPCYSPLLSLDNLPYTGLAWPPRAAAPRLNLSPPPRLPPPGF